MTLKLLDLNHIRVLRHIVRECSAEELSEPLQKLRAVIEERREEERRLQERYMQQNEKIKRLLALLQADGIPLEEVVNRCVCSTAQKSKVRPAKYRFTDRLGTTKTWTGQGRMPKVMVSALRQGKSLNDFLI
jgi:DNA-binding protein StpA